MTSSFYTDIEATRTYFKPEKVLIKENELEKKAMQLDELVADKGNTKYVSLVYIELVNHLDH